MVYSKMLRELLSGINLKPDDLLQLETFQIAYLPDRVPRKEFSALLRANPHIQRFLIAKYPLIESFITEVLNEHEEVHNEKAIDEYCDELLWEIADLIVYNKYPEVYETRGNFNWDLEEIIPVDSIKGKTLADVGAATGVLAFMLAEYAETIYAIEPVSSFRSFIREKAEKAKVSNIYAIEGFLDLIPLPENSIDVLFTSNAIGWNLEKELKEIERVVKPGGQAVHLMRTMSKDDENPVHDILTTSEWGYEYTEFTRRGGQKIKYGKVMTAP